MNHNEPSLSHGYLQAPPEQTVVCGLGAPLFSSLLCLGLSFTSCVPVSASYLAVLSDPPVLSFASCCIFALSASTNRNDCFFFSLFQYEVFLVLCQGMHQKGALCSCGTWHTASLATSSSDAGRLLFSSEKNSFRGSWAPVHEDSSNALQLFSDLMW